MNVNKLKIKIVKDIVEMKSFLKDDNRFENYVSNQLEILIMHTKYEINLSKQIDKPIEIDTHGGNDIPNL